MIRYMITGLTAAALCTAPVLAAKADAAKKDQAEQASLISVADFAPYVLFGGSMIYLYTVKQQCNKLEDELKKNSGKDELEKRIAALEKKWKAANEFDDEDEKDFEEAKKNAGNNGSSSSSSSISDHLNDKNKKSSNAQRRPSNDKKDEEDEKKKTNSNANGSSSSATGSNSEGGDNEGLRPPTFQFNDKSVDEPDTDTDHESENEDYETAKDTAKKPTAEGAHKAE